MTIESNAEVALAVYGTMAPGESNNWLLAQLSGTWTQGTVQGYLFEITWGPAEGYPGFVPDRDGHEVTVHVLQSADLPGRWRELDDFEGAGYERRVIEVVTEGSGTIEAQVYVALTDV